MLEELANAGHLFIFEKDRDGRYVGCNESFARAAGLDSAQQIVGKRDSELYWHEQAGFFQRGDQAVMRGAQMLNTPEMQIQPGVIAKIVTTKLRKADGNGVIGSFIDLTGYMIVKKNGRFDAATGRFYLGPVSVFGNEHLEPRELDVFREILMGYTTGEIALRLGLSAGTVSWYTDRIKQKLQCTKRAQILHVAMHHGLTHIVT